MTYLQWIISIGGAITAITLICKAIVELVHIADDMHHIKEHTEENYLAILRLTVMSSDMPIGERIIAGDKYIKAGGNGEIKEYIEKKLCAKEVKRSD